MNALKYVNVNNFLETRNIDVVLPLVEVAFYYIGKKHCHTQHSLR